MDIVFDDKFFYILSLVFVIGGLSIVIVFESLRAMRYKSVFGHWPLLAIIFEIIYCILMVPYVSFSDELLCRQIALVFCAVSCWLLLFFSKITSHALSEKNKYINIYLIESSGLLAAYLQAHVYTTLPLDLVILLQKF